MFRISFASETPRREGISPFRYDTSNTSNIWRACVPATEPLPLLMKTELLEHKGHAGVSNDAVAFVPQPPLRGLGCLHVAAQLNDIVLLGR